MNQNKEYMKEKKEKKQEFDYKLHLAQQVEILNQTLDLLKNNVYGQTQVDIILSGLEQGKSLDEALEYSTKMIDKINEYNYNRLEQKKKEFEEHQKAQEAKNAALN